MPAEANGDGETAERAVRLQATCVSVGGKAILLRGPPGAGKSDLAFRLIAGPPPVAQPSAYLVADDQVQIALREGRLMASAPVPVATMLEIRGVGIRQVPVVKEAQVTLIVDLVGAETVVRLPSDPLPSEDILGVEVPRAGLAPFEASAPLKLRALAGAWGGNAV